MESARPPTDTLTPAQRQAVAARGNVLVMAGAGTGKTKTLVERCVDCLANERAALDELLIVTFTEAAAAELRLRLRRELEKRAAAEPAEEYWPHQLALFDLAHIGTLHGFCLRLVREHFHELGLDPQMTILDEGEAHQLATETLDEQFKEHYEGADPFSEAVQSLIQVHGGGRDEKIRALILRLQAYAQSRPDASDWLARQAAAFAQPEPADWQAWLTTAIATWRQEWLEELTALAGENPKAAELASILKTLPENPPRAVAATLLDQVLSADGEWPARKKTVLRKPIEGIFEEAAFLLSVTAQKDGKDPLTEDWEWVRGQMGTLVRLAQTFTTRFAMGKRERGALDFHDLEQFALQLLWDGAAQRPTATAEKWRRKLRFLFVDEYQDINAAQDQIVAALAREGALANRFLVGDVKQSIYRFRLADPRIFRHYAVEWDGAAGKVIALSENFRSREGLLAFVNSVFQMVLREEVGGVGYGDDARLQFGAPEKRAVLAHTEPRVELLLLAKTKPGEAGEDDAEGLIDVDDATKEARLIAQRLRQLVAAGQTIWDETLKAERPVRFGDMAVLLRAPGAKAEVYAKEFERVGVPLAVARGGFFQSAEILDLLSLLQLLDNPLQDVPCLAVLRSPLVGLSLDELAEIRLTAREKHFWTALNRVQDSQPKLKSWLARFAYWRKLARQASLTECLEAVLTETFYADWLKTQPRGNQRAANVARFLDLARHFDQFQRQGLFRFLQFIEAQTAAGAEPEAPATHSEDAVRLMSIHQSKGLEFPVVALPDLSKVFNEQDLRSEIIFDEQFGLCPKIKPPHTGRRYPSLPHWLAQQRQRRELRGEELRLLYVALTRARDTLILAATVPDKKWTTIWKQPVMVSARHLAEARSFADWLGLWFARHVGTADAVQGETSLLRWRIVDETELAAVPAASSATALATASTPVAWDASTDAALCARLDWSYPQVAATLRKAKSSVTELRRAADLQDEEAEPLMPPPARTLAPSTAGRRAVSAADFGLAHHKFLQLVSLDKTGDLTAEADRMVQEKILLPEERAVLDLPALADFWASEFGREITAQADQVRREWPFTARFSPAEIAAATGAPAPAGLADEFIVVQGVADLLVLRPQEIWLLDFKTDAVTSDRLAEKIRTYTPQLQLYALALARIFRRPVTRRALYFLAVRHLEMLAGPAPKTGQPGRPGQLTWDW